jgi:hypothetical protein
MLRKTALAAAVAVAVSTFFLGATRPRAVRKQTPPTFSKEVVRIFQNNCQTCHHPGDIAPFSLMTYETAQPWASNIKLMTSTRRMPPWKPTSGCGEFAEARVLSQEDIDTIARWVDAGAPEGNPADLPTPLNFDSGWAMGQPDLVLSYPEAYTPPGGGDMYRCFTIPTNLIADQYVSAIDIHPGDRATVHHVIAYLDNEGQSVALDEKDPGPGYTSFGGPGFTLTDPATLGGWAPGFRPTKLPEGVAFPLPARSRIVLQVHYYPHNGQPGPDRTEMALYFSKTKPAKLMRVVPVINTTFTIPPNDNNYKVSAGIPIIPVPVHVWLIAPHMHLLGKKMTVTATLPWNETKCLINIDDWDFNWQGLYRYKEPIALPAFSSVALDAWYDNSVDNWRNPNNPPKPVSWGEQTTDEMCIAFIGVTLDGEDLTRNVKADLSWIPPMR